MRTRVRKLATLAADLRARVSPPPVVVARDVLANGEVVTTQYADYRSPSGSRWKTEALYPDGSRAEMTWAQHTVDADSAHDGAIARHRRRTLPER